MQTDFSRAQHTVIVSDIHLADAEPPHPKIPLWKKFKTRELFVDPVFRDFIQYIRKEADGQIELVLNGDIFDFDSVMKLPKNPAFHMSWLERRRGLRSEEAKSLFKFKIILEDHAVWVQSLSEFVRAGNRIVFVIGNHDIELHWPSVQAEFVDRLGLSDADRDRVRFVEWFYISNGDTMIEHGNQYDAYCVCSNPISPAIRNHHGSHIRLPFGNLAGKFMLNGMGLMNPHAEASYIRSSIWEYLTFYYRYVMRTQPFLMLTWFWSAIVTLIVSIDEGFRPAMTDPLTIGDRVEHIAAKANATPRTVLALRELHAHPAYFNPFQILRELWLDRAILLALAVYISFQFFSFLNVFVTRIALVVHHSFDDASSAFHFLRALGELRCLSHSESSTRLASDRLEDYESVTDRARAYSPGKSLQRGFRRIFEYGNLVACVLRCGMHAASWSQVFCVDQAQFEWRGSHFGALRMAAVEGCSVSRYDCSYFANFWLVNSG